MIGAGNIGRTLGTLLSTAGHSVRYGVRNPEAAGDDAGTPADAVAHGDVVIFAGPFGAWPGFAAENQGALSGKVVIDASNPVLNRDGELATRVVDSGLGSARFVAELVPDAEIAKAFNTVYWIDLRDQAGRSGELLGMPIVADADSAARVSAELARDAGFEPVIVGGLERGIDLDPGSAVYAASLTAAKIRSALGLEGNRE